MKITETNRIKNSNKPKQTPLVWGNNTRYDFGQGGQGSHKAPTLSQQVNKAETNGTNSV